MTFRISWMWVSRSIDGFARCTRSPKPVKLGVTRRCPAACISGCIFFHDHPAPHAPWQTRKVFPMTFLTIAVLFLGALTGGFVAGLAGFGTALMALGIWLYVLPPTTAVPLVLICSVVAQTSTIPSIWRTIDFKLVWPFLIGGLAGVPLGTLLIAYADPQTFKLSVGVLLLVFPTALYFQRA